MNTENKCFIPGDIVICKIDNIKLSVEKKDNKYYYIDL